MADYSHRAIRQVYQQSLNFRISELYYDQILKAATFGQLGRNKAGKECVKKLLELKPDFSSKGHVLIGH
jgi:hypothetical protein